MASSSPSGIVSASARLYRVLLGAYPARFRREYGAPMLQVFRDCCREAARQRGLYGIAVVWLTALRDLLVSAIVERVAEALRLSRAQCVRWGGLASILGGGLWVAETIGAVVAPSAHWVTADTEVILAPSLYRLYGLLFALGALGVLGGVAGLAARRVAGPGWLGRAGFYVAAGGAGLYALSGLAQATTLRFYGALWGPGFFSLGIGMTLAGVAIIRARGVPRWRALPLVIGLWPPLLIAVVVSYPHPGSWDGMFVGFGLLWALLGYALRSDTGEEAAPPPLAAA